MSSINWKALFEQYHTIGHGNKAGFFAWIEAEYGVNKDKFHRERRKAEGKMKTLTKDKDQRKRELVKHIMQMKERGKQRSDFARELSTERCINRMIRKGIMDEGELSAAHANYIARTEFRYREETPRVRWEADYALQEVQADGSTSKFFRPWKYDESGNLLLKASGRPLSYRHNEEREKLILWQYQDKYSRLRTVRAFPGKAESTAIMASHMNFWLNREKDDHPMVHLPWELAHDNASMFKTDEYKSLSKALDFSYRMSMPYEKTGIGSVENRWKNIWQWELEWSEDYDTLYLHEYNELLHTAMIAEVYEDHPYLNGKKGELYQQSILRQEPRPRVVEVDVMSLMSSSYVRTVTQELAISVENEKLRVPQYWYGIPLIGEKVNVFLNWRGEYKAELVDVPDYAVEEARTAFELTEFVHRSKGDFSKSHKQTYQQRLKDQIKSGDGLYDAIMAGKVALDDTGQPYDLETGEMIEAPKPIALQPKKKVHKPASPFVESDLEPAEKKFKSTYQARVWIGQQLKSVGLSYEQVESYFGPRLVRDFDLDRGLIKQAVDRLKENLNRKAVNQ